jgi:hypothetical protein
MKLRYLLSTVLFFSASLAFGDDPPAPDTISFRKDIAPILLERCLACHGPKKAEGGYRVDSYERVTREGDSGSEGFFAGDVEASEAFRRMVSEDVEERMPLESDRLPAEQIELFRRWVSDGAKFDGEDPKAELITIVPPPEYQPAPEVYRFPMPIMAMAFSQDGKEVTVGGYHELTVWSVETGKLVRRIGNIGQRTRALSFSPDYKHLAVACGAPGKRGEARILNAATGEVATVLAATSDEMFDLAFNPAGDHVATAAGDGTISVFAFPGGEIVQQIRSHSDWVHAVAWNADGSKLASASRDKTAKVFDVKTGELLITYSGHKESVRGVAFHPTGEEVYSSGADKKIHRWKVADGKSAAQIAFGGEVFKLPAFGDTFVACSADKTVRRFEAATHKELKSFAGSEDWAISVHLHPESKRIASGAMDGWVRIWDADSGELVVSFLAAPGTTQ